MSDEFVDVILGKLVEALRPGLYDQLEEATLNAAHDRQEVQSADTLFLSAGAAAAALGGALPSKAGELPIEPWMKLPGSGFVGYGQPSKFESKVARTFASLPGTTGAGAARTPHHLLDGKLPSLASTSDSVEKLSAGRAQLRPFRFQARDHRALIRD